MLIELAHQGQGEGKPALHWAGAEPAFFESGGRTRIVRVSALQF